MTTLTSFFKTDLVDDHTANDMNILIAAALRPEFANTETITATKTLTDNDCQFQFITASGADRTVLLAPEATTNHVTIVYNAGASNNVVVKDDSGTTTLATLAADQWSILYPLNAKGWKTASATFATSAEVLTGTEAAKSVSPDTLNDVVTRIPFGGMMMNGKISATVASNNLTLALKTLAGADPSASDPVYVRIGATVRTVTAALSVTVNAGTDTFGLGNFGCLTDQDLFAYLGYRAASSTVFIAAARICHGVTYADFSGTATAQNYLAYSGSAPASTDEVEVIGRFNVTTSGSASYNWSIPATAVVISRPIYTTRALTWSPTYSASGSMTFTSVTTNTAKYIVKYGAFYTSLVAFGTTGGTASTALRATLPFNVANYTGNPAIGGFTADGAGFIAGPGFIDSTTANLLTVRKYDFSNYGLGTNRYLAANGDLLL